MKFTRMCLGHMKPAMETYFNHLNGVFCIYKPTGSSTLNSVSRLKENILKELNALPAYNHEIEKYYRDTDLLPIANSSGRVPVTTNVPEKVTDFSRHKLVIGDMFITDDIDVRFLHGMGQHGSGVLVCCIGKEGKANLDMIKMAKFLRVYHVKGRLGYATDNYYTDGHFIERTTYNHINKGKMDKVCSAAQSSHQRLMFQCAGVNPHSQEAYELASQGLIRPADDNTTPILYGVRCVDFTPPDFTLEVHAINENNNYLAQLVHDIGLELKSTAVCTHIHRLRYGMFTLDYTLLTKQWHIPEISRNIEICSRLLTPENLLTDMRLNTLGKKPRTDVLSISGQGGYGGDGPSTADVLQQRAEEELNKLREKLRAQSTHSDGFTFKDSDVKSTEGGDNSGDNVVHNLSSRNGS